MTRPAHARLRIPAVLVVSVVALPAGCGDDGGGGETEGDSAPATAAADTGELPDCQAIAAETSCEALMSCLWRPELGGCIVDCSIVEGEAACSAEVGCAWYGDADGCDFQPVA